MSAPRRVQQVELFRTSETDARQDFSAVFRALGFRR